jgi:chromosomal replication initiation ATPase DnaA
MKQLAIDLPHRPALGRADFVVSACNSEALAWIERWPDRPARALVLYGPPRSGKSHLAQLWRERSGGVVVTGDALRALAPDRLAASGAVAVDEADAAPEEALLHLCNCCREAGAGFLVVAREAPASWPLALPDLASRLRAMPAVAIAPPDDSLLAAVLVKHFADRQVQIEPRVIAFLVERMERTFAAAALVAERLDRLTLGSRRPIGLARARQALSELDDGTEEVTAATGR